MRNRSCRCFAIAAAALLLAALAASASQAANPLTVHEWGTFTALQDDDGRAVGGINIDDEPLPNFVHNLDPLIFNRPLQNVNYLSKAAPRRHPLVRLRLETPVVYFYPAKGQPLPENLNLKVSFRGGWLTEFYPQAEANAPGLREGKFNFGPLTPQTVGSLAWNNLKLDTHFAGPETDSHVWLAPRKPNSLSLTAESGESEKYLFYRGVGNFDAPLRVETPYPGDKITLKSNFAPVLSGEERVPIGPLWLVHIRADGSTAYRTISGVEATAHPDKVMATVERTFADNDFSQQNINQLCAAMHPALMAQGLYSDEATALLDTWRRAYFKSPGLRLFFLVPRRWTDHYLPLSVSVPADLERVMVARIELISPEQRKLLRELRESTLSDLRWLNAIDQNSPAGRKFLEGHSDFGDLGVKIPRDYQMYLDMGRFRNALVLAEEKHHPNSTLTKFIDSYGLHEFRWQDAERGQPATKR